MTKEAIHLFLESETVFTFAKTMANIPHSWICRKDYKEHKFLKAMNPSISTDFFFLLITELI